MKVKCPICGSNMTDVVFERTVPVRVCPTCSNTIPVSAMEAFKLKQTKQLINNKENER